VKHKYRVILYRTNVINEYLKRYIQPAIM